ncbi:MAG: GTPase ObgE, partial [Desulfatiglandales bacterium]
MAFFDDVVITVRGGDGGSGCVSFAHRRFQPKAGPDGGNGGDGGSVYLRATRELNSLEPYRYKKDFRAQDGTHGQGNDRDGRRGRDLILDVPLGTVVVDLGRGMVLKELLTDGDTLLVAKGGAGGKGNKFFRSPTNRAPRFAGK